MTTQISIDSEHLISLVESHPVIWDKSLNTYKNRDVTKEAWDEILSVLVSDYDDLDQPAQLLIGKIVISKWTHIRDSYFRSHKKILEQKNSKGSKLSKPYVYNNNLSFLKKLIYPRSRQIEEDTVGDLGEDDDDCSVVDYEETPEPPKRCKFAKAPPQRALKTKVKLKQKRPLIELETSPIDVKMKKFVGSFSQESTPSLDHLATKTPNNRHLSFFDSILPTLDNFHEDEVLEFQVGVLKLIKSIKNNRRNNKLNSPCSSDEEVNPIKIETDDE